MSFRKTAAVSALLLALGLAGGAAEDAVRAIAPTGALRVAVAVGPAGSTFWATRDPQSGEPRGVTVELAKAAAEKLHIPLKLVEYKNSGEIAAAASKSEWDISFMPADAEREKYVDQGPSYVVYESSYLVRAGTGIKEMAEVDRAGVHVGVIEGTATSRTVAKALKNAWLATYAKPEAAAAAMRDGNLDALAMGRDALADLAKTLPGSRVLDGAVQSTGVVVAVPKNRVATRDWAAQFVEGAKADGTVRRAFDSAGFETTEVAPPGR
ncbi:MAG: transporter substrate-binding domain-containing protein [Xanthobacteraceae bacterium]|nr:transporter substrate-binding domain-containing protein [Xanthobacteraceae bacterium]